MVLPVSAVSSVMASLVMRLPVQALAIAADALLGLAGAFLVSAVPDALWPGFLGESQLLDAAVELSPPF